MQDAAVPDSNFDRTADADLHDSASLPPAAPAADVEAPRAEESNIKETVEQILIAFILAFIFRAFVVEAFVIPTGSMAPTLLGAHMRFVCEDCGYQFDENYNASPNGSDDIVMPANNRAAGDVMRVTVCPNCGYRFPASEPKDPAYSPLVRYGDRILVLKYQYLIAPPQRWDVVVFKAPVSQQQYDFGQNYIKRLIGRPHEAIAVVDGDVYSGPSDAPIEQLTVQTKPRKVQEALWRIVSDSDFVPRGMPRSEPWAPPWIMRSGQTGWTSTSVKTGQPTPRSFQFNNSTGSAELLFKDTANSGEFRPSKLNDWLAYDADPRGQVTPGYNGWNSVADLKCQFYYEHQSGDGPIQVRLAKRGETFIAELNAQSAHLLHESADGSVSEIIDASAIRFGDGPHKVEFSNVDYQVSLYVDDNLIFTTTPAQYHPDVARLIAEQRGEAPPPPPPSAAIRASKQQCTISHLTLWRDVYYINHGASPPIRNATIDNPMRLGDDEYFVMGDNSQVSFDGRYWYEPIDLPNEQLKADAGKVPGRLLLGKAFFVYWPAGFRPFDSAPAIAPDFGDMRLIH